MYLAGLIVSFYLLYFFSEHYFIPSLDKISGRFKLSSDISGATLMAAGSSAPELAVVIVSILKSGSHESIGIGTIIGSALFNLFVIAGGVMVIKSNQKMVWQPLVRDLVFYALSIVFLVWFFSDGVFSLWEAAAFTGSYLIYFGVLYGWKKWFPYKDIEPPETERESTLNRFDSFLKRMIPKANNLYVAFILDVAVISLLSWLLVTSAVEVSGILGIPEVIIALTVVALGTSVPDLIASLVVARQGRPGMAINNAIGSNIFDILIGLGFPFLLLFIFSGKSMPVENSNLWLSFMLLMGSIVIITFGFLITKWKTNRIVGWLLIILYALYLLYQIACVLGLEIYS
jgi:K+-dependent Na+/Ca+ exchanger-like protein